MKTDRVVRLLLAISHLVSAAVLSKVSQDKVVNVRVSRVVPRHQCRRALRNLEVRAILYYIYYIIQIETISWINN